MCRKFSGGVFGSYSCEEVREVGLEGGGLIVKYCIGSFGRFYRSFGVGKVRVV